MPLANAEHVVYLSVAILIVLFLFQRFGTNKVSFSFSPIMVLCFSFTATIGLYNIIKFYPSILKALSPHYIFYFFQRNHRKGWELLGAIALCITGAEAMFADLEAAFLIKNPDRISTAFYSSVPEPIFWPMFIISTLAAVVASQALISAKSSQINDYMNFQVEIDAEMRAKVAYWLIQVHEEYQLMPETLYLTLQIMDRYLSIQTVKRRTLQFVGINSMLIACKYVEKRGSPKVHELVSISRMTYNKSYILKMEKSILNKLDWSVTVPKQWACMSFSCVL
ncbi:hypothetical protein M5K25_021245 [Dendrobium thyrsiflorum]|uniref:Cyclin-like domain-containing protein n=1 Tax=Dendrobium thyrsiflorum TaxID=117978 RepID=A0ABD0UCQ2_DENTH